MTSFIAIPIAAILQSQGISGNVPVGAVNLQPPGHVMWLPATPSESDETRRCLLTSATRWSCPTVSTGESGVVVIPTEGAVSYVIVGPAGIASTGTAPWGRLVRVVPAGLEKTGALRASAWVLDRPASRPNAQRLDAIPDDSVSVLKISDAAFWAAGRAPSADAFLRIEGAGIARQDLQLLTIAEGPSDSPFVLQSSPAASISGRVETRSAEPVEGALVELFSRPPGSAPQPAGRVPSKGPVIRLAGVTTDADGRFDFPDLADGEYEVVATSFSHGRLNRWTTTTSPPLLLRLTPPTIVSGRVVRQKLPVPEVRVRFVPNSTAWRQSTDPTSHLAAETRSDDSGRFTLALPPEAEGDVQFIAPDGASLRRPLPHVPNLAEIALGDVALTELIAVEIRADTPGCRMTAIGPAGAMGLALVQGRVALTIYHFDLPEPGEWFLDAECAGQHVSIQPPTVMVTPKRSSSFDVHFR
jgi:Carboxypeptidase regulatory-like domain